MKKSNGAIKRLLTTTLVLMLLLCLMPAMPASANDQIHVVVRWSSGGFASVSPPGGIHTLPQAMTISAIPQDSTWEFDGWFHNGNRVAGASSIESFVVNNYDFVTINNQRYYTTYNQVSGIYELVFDASFSPRSQTDWSMNPETVSFPSATVGYGTQGTQSISIANWGSINLASVAASITSGANSFEITAHPPSSMSVGGSSTILVRPRTGLQAGTHTGTLTLSTANGGNQTVSLSFTVVPDDDGEPYIHQQTPHDGSIRQYYSYTIQAAGATNTTWTISSGSLPRGLSLNRNTGVISGTPTAAGTSDFTVRASNSLGVDTRVLSITIWDESIESWVTITPFNPEVPRGSTYQFSASVTGAGAPSQSVTWTVTGGVSGTRINQSGLLTIAANETAATLTVRAASSANSSVFDVTTVIIAPDASAPHIPHQTPAQGTVDQSYSYNLQATGTSPLAWSIATGVLPAGLSLNTGTGAIIGVPTTAGTSDFTVRATNAAGNDIRAMSITVVNQELRIVGRIGNIENNEWVKTDYNEEPLVIEGADISQFVALYFNDELLRRDVDYRVEAGSVRIPILSSTFQRYGEGVHTITAEFNIEGTPGYAIQTFTLWLSRQVRPETLGPSDDFKTPTGIHDNTGTFMVFVLSFSMAAALWAFILHRKFMKRKKKGNE